MLASIHNIYIYIMETFHIFHISLGIFHLSHLGPWDRLWFFRFSDLLDQRRWSWMNSIANTKSFMMRCKRRLTGAGRFYFLRKIKNAMGIPAMTGNAKFIPPIYLWWWLGDGLFLFYRTHLTVLYNFSLYLFYIYICIDIYTHIQRERERERVKQHYNAYCGKPNNKLSLISPGLGCTKPPKLNG